MFILIMFTLIVFTFYFQYGVHDDDDDDDEWETGHDSPGREKKKRSKDELEPQLYRHVHR